MLTKEKLKDAINHFPDRFTIDELIERLIVIEKIEKGNEQSEQGRVITDEKLDQKIEEWFK